MENASKALLIAAAVLIVILIIAFAMKVLNSTKDVSGSASDVGSAITNQSNQVADDVYKEITGQSRN